MSKSKSTKRCADGVAVIYAGFNNTHIAITTPSGDMLCHSCAGRAHFKNARKSTPYAAQLAAEIAAREAKEKYGMKRVSVKVKGPGAGRDSAIRAINSVGIKIIKLVDATPLPHNGCRPRKKRRV